MEVIKVTAVKIQIFLDKLGPPFAADALLLSMIRHMTIGPVVTVPLL